MAKLTLDELRKLRESMKKELRRREAAGKDIQVIVGMGDCGIKAGAKNTMDAFFTVLDEIDQGNGKKWLDRVLVRQVGCMGLCESEPTVEVAVPGMDLVIYGNVDAQMAKDIVSKHIIGRELLKDKILDRPAVDVK